MEHLWAPWRKAYVEDPGVRQGGVFASLAQAPATDDAANFILWRGKASFAVLNRYPYNTGHALIIPYREVAELEQLSDDELAESLSALKKVKAALAAAFAPHGFNIGLNLGSAAGAGIEQHLHWHLVPRWRADANFMTTTGDVRIHPADLPSVYAALKAHL
ncbi:MAG: HIT domain-containing protein [Verrucomicrobium sp.]|nr:HIT domain-containing protein [Verrucomicrobium sp.]